LKKNKPIKPKELFFVYKKERKTRKAKKKNQLPPDKIPNPTWSQSKSGYL